MLDKRPWERVVTDLSRELFTTCNCMFLMAMFTKNIFCQPRPGEGHRLAERRYLIIGLFHGPDLTTSFIFQKFSLEVIADHFL